VPANFYIYSCDSKSRKEKEGKKKGKGGKRKRGARPGDALAQHHDGPYLSSARLLAIAGRRGNEGRRKRGRITPDVATSAFVNHSACLMAAGPSKEGEREKGKKEEGAD